MSFSTATLPSSLKAKPRTQPEGFLKVSQKSAYLLGTLDIFATTRLGRSGGTLKDFTTTGAAADGEWWAIKATAIEDGVVQSVQVPLGITGTPAGTAECYLFSDTSGLPNAAVAGSGVSDSVTIATGISTSAGYITFTWSATPPSVLKNTDYWVVVQTTGYTYTDSVTELWLDTDTNGSSEVAKYDSNGVPTWTTAGGTVGANVVITCSTLETRDTVIDSKDDFSAYSLFATTFFPLAGARDLTLTISGTSGQSGRSNRGTGTAKDFTITGNADDGEWWAVKFTAGRTGNVTQVKAPLGRLGSPNGSVKATIYSDSTGLPNAQNNGDSADVTIVTGVSTTTGYITFTWSASYPALVAGTDYWVVLKTTGYDNYSDGVTELFLGTDTNGSSEVAKYESDGAPTWTTAGATVGSNIKVGGIAMSGSVTISGNSTYDVGKLVTVTNEDYGWGSISSIVAAGGNAYDTIHIWAVPDISTTNYDDILYFRSLDVNGGIVSMAVPDRFEPMKTSIRVRRESSIAISKDQVTYQDIYSYVGRECSVVLEMHPGGGGGVSEYIIVANCILSTPSNAPDNGKVMVNPSGNFSALMFYEP